MGATHRFLAMGSDLQHVYAWFAALPQPPRVVAGRGCQFLHFHEYGDLHDMPETGDVEVKRSPLASLFPPENLREILWTAGELHFLATPLRRVFPELNVASRRFAKWLRQFECVFDGPGTAGAWDFFLEGDLRNYDTPIYALPDSMTALRGGQYFVQHGFRGDRLDRLCRTLELRGSGRRSSGA